MSLYILDTDILTLYQLGVANIVQRTQSCPAGALAVTIISVEEQLSGWYTRLRRATKRDELARVYQRLTEAVSFLSRLRILSFAESAIIRYEQLRVSHRQMSKNDLRIAAITLENGGVLVTRNTQDFAQIAGLSIEDWSK